MPLASTPVNPNVTFVGGVTCARRLPDSVPLAGMVALPKMAAMLEDKSCSAEVPAAKVNPVSVVATPAVSVSFTVKNQL